MKLFKERHRSHHNSSGAIGKYIPPERFTEEEFLIKLNEKPGDVPRAIYVHTPYCDKICSFCNLNREQLNGSLDEYADYIAGEFQKYGQYRYFKEKGVDVIYFGGGTPTVYKGYQLEKILKSIKENILLNEGYEFTFETTLHNLTEEKLEIMKKYGVNRLSVGVQSFSENGRKFYNRTYGKEEVISRLKKLKSGFPGDVCIDIIYNFPGQTGEEAREDAALIKELGLSSSSFYGLMVHDGSALSKDIEADKVKLQNNLDIEKNLHDIFVEELTKDGEYYVLELTKIAKKNGDSYKYIKTRNSGGDTFPIGVGAGGNVGNVSVFRMMKDRSGYMKKSDFQDRVDKVTARFQFPEVNKNEIFKFLETDEITAVQNKISEFIENGLVKEDNENYYLTSEGIFWGNNIGREILQTIIACKFN